MKHYYLLSIIGGAALLLAASCNQTETAVNEDPAPVKTRTVTVRAGVGNDGTRVAFENDETFMWEEGDQIGIYTYGATPETEESYYAKFYPFTLTGGAGTNEGWFSAELPEGVDYGYVAVYPYKEYSGGFDPSDNVLTFGLPDEWEDVADLGTKVRIPMAAKIEEGAGKNRFTFYHLGGAVKIPLTGVPAETYHLTLMANGADANGCLSGGFLINRDDIGTEAMAYDFGSSSVEITFPDDAIVPQNLTVYFPVPCGEFDLIFRVEGHNGYDYMRTAWSTNVIERGTILQMPEIALPAPADGWARYEDLGLSSGTLWATRNVLADRPDVMGEDYYWGEISSNNFTVWSRYKWYASGNSDANVTFSKYGYDGGKTVSLEQADDAAHANLKGKWRMPTAAEVQELIDQAQWDAYDLAGQAGYKVTGPSGKWIFLPCQDRYSYGVWSAGYWSNELDNDDTRGVKALGFSFDNDGNIFLSGFSKMTHMLVRPVYDPALVEDLHFGNSGTPGQDVHKDDVVNGGEF